MIALIFSLLTVSFADGNITCLPLEGLNLGCISSVDHGCFMNRMVDKTAACSYVGSPATSWRVEGPIAFHCKSYRNTQHSEQVCNSDGCHSVNVTESECIEYEPPQCQETCVPCFNDVVVANVGKEKGCIICTRKPCPDEQDATPAKIACPPTYNGLINHNGEKCSTDTHCPATATDPLGVVHQVQISKGSCPVPAMPQAPSAVVLYDCPWKVDPNRKSCSDPIPDDLKNP